MVWSWDWDNRFTCKKTQSILNLCGMVNFTVVWRDPSSFAVWTIYILVSFLSITFGRIGYHSFYYGENLRPKTSEKPLGTWNLLLLFFSFTFLSQSRRLIALVHNYRQTNQIASTVWWKNCFNNAPALFFLYVSSWYVFTYTSPEYNTILSLQPKKPRNVIVLDWLICFGRLDRKRSEACFRTYKYSIDQILF